MNWQKQSFWQRLKNAVLVVLFLPFVLPLALLAIVLHILYKITLYLLVWVIWLPRGKDILFVYSDSPIWRDYMATEILPLVQDRAVVLNWSERKKWRRWRLGVAVFHHFAGGREFNPLVDRKSTRLNSSHSQISYAVFCLKKKKRIYSAYYSALGTSSSRLQPPCGTSRLLR